MVILAISNRNCETGGIKIRNVFDKNVYMVIAEAGYVNREEKKKFNFMCPRRNVHKRRRNLKNAGVPHDRYA